MSILSFYQPRLNAGFAIFCSSGPAAMTSVYVFKLNQKCRKLCPMFLLDKYISLLLYFWRKTRFYYTIVLGLLWSFGLTVKDKNRQIKEVVENILAWGPCTGDQGLEARIWCFPHTHNVFFCQELKIWLAVSRAVVLEHIYRNHQWANNSWEIISWHPHFISGLQQVAVTVVP